MYKIYFDKKVIILTNLREKKKTTKYFLLKDTKVEEVLYYLDNSDARKAYLYDAADEEELIERFKKKMKVITAAGGLVLNKKDEILFIKKEGMWDLPKGKVEDEEDLQGCALREVEEETKVNGLVINCFNSTTYHIFRREGVYILKETHWYNMVSDYKGELVPQEEENITKAKWKEKKKLKKVLSNSYRNIKDVVYNVYSKEEILKKAESKKKGK